MLLKILRKWQTKRRSCQMLRNRQAGSWKCDSRRLAVSPPTPPHSRIDAGIRQCLLHFTMDTLVNGHDACRAYPSIAEARLKADAVRLCERAAIVASYRHPCGSGFGPDVERRKTYRGVVFAKFGIERRDLGASSSI